MGHKLIIPFPISVSQLGPASCNVKTLPHLGFTRIVEGNSFCCISKITPLWLRTAVCTASKLVTCSTKSDNHLTLRFDTPMVCNARLFHVKLTNLAGSLRDFNSPKQQKVNLRLAGVPSLLLILLCVCRLERYYTVCVFDAQAI